VRPWTTTEAAAWWETFRSTAGSNPDALLAPDERMTLSVDVANRMTQTAVPTT
jgi:hypothetical protein